MTTKAEKAGEGSLRKIRHIVSRMPHRVSMGAGIVIFAVIGTILFVGSKAATPTASYEVEAGTRSSNANTVSDTSASGSSGVKFSVATSGSRCPAYPAFPDANCTGVIPGSTLTSCNGNVTQNNATYANCTFSGGVTLNGKTGVRITNSRINGVVTGDYTQSGLVMTDVEINGSNSTQDATNSVYGYTCTRCNVHDAGKGFTGSSFTVIDSYVHDLYGTGPSDGSGSHNEAVLGSTGNIVITHSNLVANFSAASPGGGMSSVISLYSHGSFWGPLDNVTVQQSRIANQSSAVYCVYGGNSTDYNPSGIKFIQNVWLKNSTCSPIVGWYKGNGNVWQDNTWSDGTAIPEPSTNDY